MEQPQYEAVHEMDDDMVFYKKMLDNAYKILSEETLRQWLDDNGSSICQKVLAKNVDKLRSNGIHPSKLKDGYVPVDPDVSPFDNNFKAQEYGVSMTYKGCDGYALRLSWSRRLFD